MCVCICFCSVIESMASKQQGHVALGCLKANRGRAAGMADFENVGVAVEIAHVLTTERS